MKSWNERARKEIEA